MVLPRKELFDQLIFFQFNFKNESNVPNEKKNLKINVPNKIYINHRNIFSKLFSINLNDLSFTTYNNLNFLKV